MENEIRLPIRVIDAATSVLDNIVSKMVSTQAVMEKVVSGATKSEKVMQTLGLKTTGVFSKLAKNDIVGGIKALMNMSDTATTMQGKLALALDQGSSVNAFRDEIVQAANEARTSFDTIAEGVTGIGLAAGDLFNDDELLQFTKSLSMMYKIGGATTQEQQAAMVQIRQALAKGKLQGDEFKSLSAMPGFLELMADELGVSKGEVKELASEGKITADVFKNAMLKGAETLEDRLNTIPKTFSDRMTEVNNSLSMFQNKVGLLLNKLANTKQVVIVFEALKKVFDRLTDTANRFTRWLDSFTLKNTASEVDEIADKSEKLANILMGVVLLAVVALTAHIIKMGYEWVKAGIKAAIANWSIVGPLLIVVGIIAAVIFIAMKMGATFDEVCGFIGGIIGVTIAFVWNLFLSLIDFFLMGVNFIQNRFAVFANFFGNIFNDPVAAIINLFRNMAKTVLGILKSIASAIDKLFGSSLSKSVQGWIDGVDNLADKAVSKWGNGTYEEKVALADYTAESLGLRRMEYSSAWNKGYSIGSDIGTGLESLFGQLSKLSPEGDSTDKYGIGTNSDSLSDYDASTGTGSLATSLDEDSIDELKAFTEIQYRLQYKHITPNVNITFGDVRETADLDDVTGYLKQMMEQDLEELYIMEGD